MEMVYGKVTRHATQFSMLRVSTIVDSPANKCEILRKQLRETYSCRCYMLPLSILAKISLLSIVEALELVSIYSCRPISAIEVGSLHHRVTWFLIRFTLQQSTSPSNRNIAHSSEQWSTASTMNSGVKRGRSPDLGAAASTCTEG